MSIIQLDVKQATAELTKRFSGLQPAVIKKVIMRSINHTLAKGETEMNKQIRLIYRVAQKEVNAGILLQKASEMSLEGKIRLSRVPLRLGIFNPVMIEGDTQTKFFGSKKSGGFASAKTKKRGSGVYVEIFKGQRKRLPTAFMAISEAGNAGVKAVGHYEKSFKFAGFRQRDKTTRLTGPSIHAMFLNSQIQQPLSNKIKHDYLERLTKELERKVKGDRS